MDQKVILAMAIQQVFPSWPLRRRDEVHGSGWAWVVICIGVAVTLETSAAR